MNLRDLQYLVALADYNHFGQAARACFISQPTLSMQIKKLEEYLHVILLERSSRKVTLTPSGQEIVDHARIILREAAEIQAIAKHHQNPESDSLRFGLFPTLAPYLLPHVVTKINQQFPHLTLLLTEEKTLVLLELLNEGKIDVAALALPIENPQLHQEFIFSEPFLLAVPKTHILAKRTRIKMTDLANENLLLLEDGHCLRDQALEICQLASAHEQPGFRATSLETLRQMVAAQVGITLLPLLAIKPPVAQNENIHYLRFYPSNPSRSIALVWRKHSRLDGFLKKFAQLFQTLPVHLFKP